MAQANNHLYKKLNITLVLQCIQSGDYESNAARGAFKTHEQYLELSYLKDF